MNKSPPPKYKKKEKKKIFIYRLEREKIGRILEAEESHMKYINTTL